MGSEEVNFVSICNEIEPHQLQSLCLSVMTDSTIKNYFPIIEQGFLLKFTLDELLEILKSFDINRLEVFIKSVSEAVQHLMDFDGYQEGEMFNFLIELGEDFSELLKNNVIQVVILSKPENIHLDDYLVRRNWDIPLSLEALGWFDDLNSEQLQRLITHLKLKYRDKTIDSWIRMQYRLLIRRLKGQLKEWSEFPLENLSLTKAQIREFLDRLAGEEGCQFSALKWRCGGKEFIYARKILNLMDVPVKEQDKLLELCKKYGGHCDCEILMNAASWLINEDTPW